MSGERIFFFSTFSYKDETGVYHNLEGVSDCESFILSPSGVTNPTLEQSQILCDRKIFYSYDFAFFDPKRGEAVHQQICVTSFFFIYNIN